MKYQILHSSEYCYTHPAALSLNELCLIPRFTPFQKVIRHSFTSTPLDDYHRDRTDFFGNHWRLYAFEKPHSRLEILANHSVEVNRDNSLGINYQEVIDPFFFPSPMVRIHSYLADYGRRSFPLGRNTFDGIMDLNQRLFSDFIYDPKATTIETPLEEFFEKRKGVCQDYAHLMLAILRSLGFPARYVSGYLNTLPPPGKEKVLGADASHAWVAVHIPEMGWIDFDPTNGILVSNDHITLAWGRDYGDVTPLKGVVLGGGSQKLNVKVTVLPEAGLSRETGLS